MARLLKPTDLRTTVLNIRVSEALKSSLIRLAEEDHREDLSSYVRHVLLSHIKDADNKVVD